MDRPDRRALEGPPRALRKVEHRLPPVPPLVAVRGLLAGARGPGRPARHGHRHGGRHIRQGPPARGRCKKMGSPPDDSRDLQAIGRSRGRLTTKITVLTDRQERFARFSLRPGNAYEGRELIPLLEGVTTPDRLLADKAYDSKKIRAGPADYGTEAVIPPQRNT